MSLNSKKRILSLFIAALLLFSALFSGGVASAATAGSAQDPLITLSYVLGSYTQYALSHAKTAIDEALNSVRESAASMLGGDTGSFKSYALNPGGTIEMSLGGSVTLLSGTARLTVRGGQVVNISSGTVAGSGTELKIGCRYLATEDCSAFVTFTSAGKAALDGGASVSSFGGPIAQFSDVPASHWAYEHVNALYSLGVINGVGNNKFEPDQNISRADFVTIMGRIQGVDTTKYIGSAFSDVSATAYYAPYIKWANESGIVLGYGNGIFSPSAKISRQEMAVIIIRYAEYNKKTLTGSSSAGLFADDRNIADWARPAVYTARDAGIINGRENNIFDPKGNATRAEICAIFSRYLG